MFLDPPHQLLEKINFFTSQYYKNVIPYITRFQNICYVLTIYKSHILSKLDYESFIWTIAHKSILNKLEIHNSDFRMSIDGYRSSPITSIYNPAMSSRHKKTQNNIKSGIKISKYSSYSQLQTNALNVTNITPE